MQANYKPYKPLRALNTPSSQSSCPSHQKKFAALVIRQTIIEKEKSLKVTAGWYTEAAMTDELTYDEKLDAFRLDHSLTTCGTQCFFYRRWNILLWPQENDQEDHRLLHAEPEEADQVAWVDKMYSALSHKGVESQAPNHCMHVSKAIQV